MVQRYNIISYDMCLLVQRTFACWMSPFSALVRKDEKSFSASPSFDMTKEASARIYYLLKRAAGLPLLCKPLPSSVSPS